MKAFFLFLYIVAGVTGQGFSTTFFQNTLFGGDHSDFGVSSWIDQSRGVRYIVGQTYSSSFSGVTAPISGENTLGAPDILLIKLDQATDSVVWYTIVGTSRSDQPRAISGDSEGNIWITGTTFGSFDNSENNGAARGFVIKINSQGSTLFTKTFDSCLPTSMELDSNGNIWVAGSASNIQNSNDEDSNEDVSVIILTSTGEQLSTKTFGGSASDIAKTIAVAENTVAIGGITYSSDFPVTQGTRECEFCSGAGFVMTLTYSASAGIQQSYSTYITGEEQQSLSVVDITFDAANNLYLAIYDDANAMGAYIQQVKSDFSMGWISEKSDAFWKVEYLPLIDALYTIGSFSTPTDYATFYVLDTKTGSHVYSSKALTGALVDASVYTVDESTVKIHMIGTLQKDLKIAFHGRTYSKVHKSDDVLIVSLTIKSLTAAKKAQQQSLIEKAGEDLTAVAVNKARATDPETVIWCLWNHAAGFASFNDFITDVTKYVYRLVAGGVSVVLPIEHPSWDYDLAHGPLTELTPANAGKPARLAANTWGATFEIYFNFELPILNTSMAGVHIPGVSYVEFIVPNPTYGAKFIVSNQGRSQSGDLVAWTIELILPFDNTPKVFTFSAKKASGFHVWYVYDHDASTNNIQLFASNDEITNAQAQRPSVALFAITMDATTKNDWRTKQNLIPKIMSGCTLETHIVSAYICGLTEKVIAVPIPLAAVLPSTGTTNFPAATDAHGAWIGQVIILTTDSILGTQTKFSFSKADGGPYNTEDSWCYVYEGVPYSGKPWDLRKYYAPGYFISAKISGTGNLAGWVFDGKKQFKKGTKYYFYVAEGLFAPDNLDISEPSKYDSLVVKKDLYTRATTTNEPMLIWNSTTFKYDEITTQSVVYVATTKPFASLDSLGTTDPLPADPTNDDKDGGLIEADPWFVGYNNQKFLFKGKAGQIYNVYNDPWVNVNSLFGYANEKKKTGTVMHTIGISIGEHNLFFDIANRENRRFFDVVIDGVTTRVGVTVQHLSGCVDVQYNTKVLLVSTPRHSLRLTIEWGHNWHINVPYFDLNIHHPEEDNYKIGGILGQTAHEGTDDVDMNEDDFTVESIFSLEKSKFYNLQSIDC